MTTAATAPFLAPSYFAENLAFAGDSALCAKLAARHNLQDITVVKT
jgi:hypothetical protein